MKKEEFVKKIKPSFSSFVLLIMLLVILIIIVESLCCQCSSCRMRKNVVWQKTLDNYAADNAAAAPGSKT